MREDKQLWASYKKKTKEVGEEKKGVVGEQRAQAGAQAGQEGSEGQPDPGSSAGALLQRLAALLHHQHGTVCECVPTALFDALTWLGYCNSTMNPIIYPLFMRDFKRALGRLLPCCCCSSSSSSSSSRSPRRPSPPLSLSLRNSGEPHVPSDPPSLSSDPPQPPATATDAVNLFDAEHAGSRLPLLLPNQVDTLD